MQKLNELLKSKTLSHSAITLSATAVNGILGLFFFISLARSLGPEKFGLLSVSLAALTLVADIADVGINTGLINFISKNWDRNNNQALKFMKLGLESKILVWIVVLAVFWFISPTIAEKFFLKSELTLLLRISLIGVGCSLLFSFVTNCLQALQKFKLWSFLNIFTNSLRLILVLVLISYSVINEVNALVIYIGVLLFGTFIGLLFLPSKFISIKGEVGVAKEFFSYNKWVATCIIIAAIASRLDTFLLTRFLSINEVGIYSVANQLSLILPQVVYAVATVVAPKLASLDTTKKARQYLKKLQLFVAGLSLVGLLVIPISWFLIPIFYGSQYQDSVLPFVILWISQLIFLLSTPTHQAIFYYFSKPKVFTLISTINLLIIAFFGVILIPTLGMVGGALAVLIGSIFNFIAPFLWVINKFSTEDN